MAKVSEMIQSKFLRKEDVEDDLIVTVKDCRLEDMPGDGGEQRWVLFFRELPKGLVLNSTTIRVLEKAFGNDSDDWIGKRVTLYVDPNVSFRGQVVGGLRIRPMKPRNAAAATAQLAKPAADFDDEIPI